MAYGICSSFSACLRREQKQPAPKAAEPESVIKGKLSSFYEPGLTGPSTVGVKRRHVQTQSPDSRKQPATQSRTGVKPARVKPARVKQSNVSKTPITVEQAMSLIPNGYYKAMGYLAGLSEEKIARIKDQYDNREQCMKHVYQEMHKKGELTGEWLATSFSLIHENMAAKNVAQMLDISPEKILLPDVSEDTSDNPDRPLSVMEISLYFGNKDGPISNKQYVDLCVEMGVPPLKILNVLTTHPLYQERKQAFSYALKEHAQPTARTLHRNLINVKNGLASRSLARAFGLSEEPRRPDFSVGAGSEALNQPISFRDLYYLLGLDPVAGEKLASALGVHNDPGCGEAAFYILLDACDKGHVKTVNDVVRLLYKRPMNNKRHACQLSQLIRGVTGEQYIDLSEVNNAVKSLDTERLQTLRLHLGVSKGAVERDSINSGSEWACMCIVEADQQGLLTAPNLVYALEKSGESVLLATLRRQLPELRSVRGEQQKPVLPYGLDLPVLVSGAKPVSRPLAKADIIELPPHNWFLLGFALGVRCRDLLAIEGDGKEDATVCLCLLAEKLVQDECNYETGDLWKALELLQDEETLAALPQHMKVEPSTELAGLTHHSQNNLEVLGLAGTVKNHPAAFARKLGVNMPEQRTSGHYAELRRIIEIYQDIDNRYDKDDVHRGLKMAKRYCLSAADRHRSAREARRPGPYTRKPLWK